MDDIGTFFIITPLFFESVALDELKEKSEIYDLNIDFENVVIQDGGIELKTPHKVGFALNHILKIPTRIFLRIDSFKCRDFPKLHKKISKVEWKRYLIGQYPKIDTTAKKSRIINTKRVESTVDSAIEKYYRANSPKKVDLERSKDAHTILYIRIVNDHCTLSIDASGDRLNIRGERTLVGTAPIRENLAAGLLYSLKDKFKNIDALVDPMCGSGTTLIEARDFYTVNNSREFSYQFFPIFDKSQQIVFCEVKQSLFDILYGHDVDSKMVDIARQNIKWGAEVDKRDATKVYDGPKGVGIFINPPYGQRIIPDNKLFHFYTDVIAGICSTYEPKMIAMIIPKSLKISKIKVPKGYDLNELYRFKNGGLNVKLIAINQL